MCKFLKAARTMGEAHRTTFCALLTVVFIFVCVYLPINVVSAQEVSKQAVMSIKPSLFESAKTNVLVIVFGALGIIIIFMTYSMFNLVLRLKAEKEREIALIDLQESYMELEAAHEELLASEEELNRQFQEIQSKELLLKESRERYRLASKGAEVGIWDWDMKQDFIYFSTKANEIMGIKERGGLLHKKDIINKVVEQDKELLKRAFVSHEKGEADSFDATIRMEVADERYVWVKIRGKALLDESGNAIRIAGSINNINKEKLNEAKIHKLAFYDDLTELPNREYFNQRLNDLILNIDIEKFAVMFVDVDNFKMINESLGHKYGDEVLKKIGTILKDRMGERGEWIRFGGDEFIAIVEDYSDMNDIQKMAEEIMKAFRGKIEIGGLGFVLTLSMGISVYPEDGSDSNLILKHADTALNEAKRKGKNAFQIYTQALSQNATNKVVFENELRQAIDEKQFVIYYQPQYDVSKRKIISYEALIRWMHPTKGVVGPMDFIPIAEERGWIIEMGEFVFEEAIRQLKEWEDAGHVVNMSVNLSAKQFRDIKLIEFCEEITGKYHIAPNRVELEITETIALTDIVYTNQILEQLRALGFRIALDDFGTGYSSLNYFKSLPIDVVKIDKSFVHGMNLKAGAKEIISTIIQLAHAFGRVVIAEGVEEAEELEYLTDLSCDMIQGYYIGRPIPPQEVFTKP